MAIYDLAKRLSGESGQGGRRWADGVVVCVAASALVIQMQAVRMWGNLYVSDVRSINQADVAAGQWLAANTPANALIAANTALQPIMQLS